MTDQSNLTDPVCGMAVSVDTAGATAAYAGQTFYFCSAHCAATFRATPGAYAAGPEPAQPPATGHRAPPILEPQPPLPAAQPPEYTCPMHPEIVRNAPGACPICGMALEPRAITLDEGENPELVDMRRRFWVSTALTLPVFIIAMRHYLPGDPWPG